MRFVSFHLCTLLFTIISFAVPLEQISVDSNSTRLSRTVSLSTQVPAPKDPLSRIYFNLLNQDIHTMNLIKYILAMKLELAPYLLRTGVELEALSEAVHQFDPFQLSNSQPSSSNAIRRSTEGSPTYDNRGSGLGESIYQNLLEIYPPQIFPQVYQETEELTSKIKSYYNSNWAFLWLSKLIKCSIDLVLLDVEILILEKQIKVVNLEKKLDLSIKLSKLNKDRQALVENNDAKILLLPIFNNITVKKDPFAFWFFNKEPSYMLYEYLFSTLFSSELGYLVKYYPFGYDPTTRNIHAKELATWLHFHNYDPSERSYHLALPTLQVRLNEIKNQQTDSKGVLLFNSNLLASSKNVLIEIIYEQTINFKKSIELMSQEPILEDASIINPYVGETVFLMNNKSFFKNFSFLYLMEPLHEDVFKKYNGKSPAFSLFEIQQFQNELREYFYEDIIERSDTTTTSALFVLGTISMVLPYGTVLSPMFFSAGIGYGWFGKVIPNYMFSTRQKGLLTITSDPFDFVENPLSTSQVRLEAHQRVQEAKTDSIWNLISTGLFSFPIVKGLSSTLAEKMPLTSPYEMMRLWKIKYRDFLKNFLKEEIEKQAISVNNGLIKMSQLALFKLLNQQPIIYSVSFFGLLFYYIDEEDQSLNDTNDSFKLTQDQSYLYFNQNKNYVLSIAKKVSNTFAHVDRSLQISIMKQFYSSSESKETDRIDWFQLYDGDKVIILQGNWVKNLDLAQTQPTITAFIPLRMFTTMNQNQLVSSLTYEIAKQHLSQQVVASDTMKALYQKNNVGYIKMLLEDESPLKDPRLYIKGKKMMVYYNDQLTLTVPLTKSRKELLEEAILMAQKYEGSYQP